MEDDPFAEEELDEEEEAALRGFSVQMIATPGESTMVLTVT